LQIIAQLNGLERIPFRRLSAIVSSSRNRYGNDPKFFAPLSLSQFHQEIQMSALTVTAINKMKLIRVEFHKWWDDPWQLLWVRESRRYSSCSRSASSTRARHSWFSTWNFQSLKPQIIPPELLLLRS
jgi:hypothetical protein